MHMICKQKIRCQMEMEMKLMKEPKSGGWAWAEALGGSNRPKLPTAKMWKGWGWKGQRQQATGN